MTSEALITQLDRRDADCDFTIRPTRHRLRLNQTLPCAIALHNAFQQPAPNPQSDTNETVAGGQRGRKPYFWRRRDPCGALAGAPYTVGTTLDSFNHSNLPPYISLHFDEPRLSGTIQYNAQDAKTDKTDTSLVGDQRIGRNRDVNAVGR